jgi:nucleoside-diphosphate-sugar epimerase
MKNRSVSITGATGFVGWHVAESFLSDGWDVRAIVRRGNRRPVPPGATIIESDLSRESLTTAFSPSDVVVHSAALIRAGTQAAFDAVNVEGSRAAGAAAAAVGARLVLVSSQAAGGQGTPDAPRSESDPPSPVNAYGRSKLAAEEAVRAIDRLRWVILRPSAVYGPLDRGFLPLFRMASRGLFLVPSGQGASFTLIHIADLTRAVRLAAESPRAEGETMFVGHPNPQSGADVLRAIAAALARPFRPRHIPAVLMTAAAKAGDLSWKVGVKPLVDSGRLVELRARGFVCSVDRVRQVLGFEATRDLQEGIAETARWYRDRGWI